MGWWGKPLDEEGCCTGGLFGGVIDDYRRRLPNYCKDITQGFDKKTLSSALFMFFATFFSTASLGALIQKTTNKRIGLEEYLLMNAIAGMSHALFGCQVQSHVHRSSDKPWAPSSSDANSWLASAAAGSASNRSNYLSLIHI